MSVDIHKIDSREESTMVSNWTIHLCAKKINNNLKICHMHRKVLGELSDFQEYDENDELISDGYPEEVDGEMVYGIEDDFVLGYDLEEDEQYDHMLIELSLTFPESDIIKFLKNERWDVSNLDQIKKIWLKVKK